MNIGKSIEHAIINTGMQKKELAKALEVTPIQVSRLCAQSTCSGKMLDKLCTVFNMKASDFVALGE